MKLSCGLLAVGALALIPPAPAAATETDVQLYECVTTTTTIRQTKYLSNGTIVTDEITTVQRVCTPI